MYRSSSSRHQEWTVTHVAPMRLPRFVQARSAQHRLKKFGAIKPTAVVKPTQMLPTVPQPPITFDQTQEKLGFRGYEWSDSAIRKDSKLSKIYEYEEEKEVSWNEKAVEQMQDDNMKRKITELEFKMRQMDSELKSQDSVLNSAHNELVRRAQIAETLEKDKKLLQDLLKKSKDVHFEAELQLANVTKAHSKSEQLLDVARNDADRERSLKQNLERENKRLENDLKISSETVEEHEKLVKQLQSKLASKQEDLLALVTKLEEHQQLIVKLQVEIKILQEKVTLVEKQLAKETQARMTAEQTEAALKNEIDQISTKFEKLLTEHSQQLEATRQKEMELSKVKHELSKSIDEREAIISHLKDKFADQILALNEQISTLQTEKIRLEKHGVELQRKTEEANAIIESTLKEKENMELKKNRMDVKAFEAQLRVEEQQGEMAELAGQKQKLAVENGKLIVQLADADTRINELLAKRQELERNLHLTSLDLAQETQEKNYAKEQARKLVDDVETLRNQFINLEEAKNDLARHLNRANAEKQQLNAKLDEAEFIKTHELEQQKIYYDKKLVQAAEENETLNGRINSLEKIRTHLAKDISDLQQSLEIANNTIYMYDKKIKHYEKMMVEWEQKCNDMAAELKAVQDENRTLQSLADRLQRYLSDAADEIAGLHGENEKLRTELRNLNNELVEMTSKAREAENQRRRLTEENEFINKNLTNAETTITNKTEKIARMQKEIDNFNTIIEEKLAEKAAEFELIRKTLRETIDNLQKSLEEEVVCRTEAVKQKKWTETKLGEYEMLLEQANLYRAEAHNQARKLQEQNRSLAFQVERNDDLRKRLEENLDRISRQAADLERERDMLLAHVKQLETALKELEQKVAELDMKLTQKTVDHDFLVSLKSKLEADLLNLQVEFETVSNRLAESERKLAESEAERRLLCDQLAREREALSVSEQTRRILENRNAELENECERLERETTIAVEKAVASLQQRLDDAENDLKVERLRHYETQKREQHFEKQVKETQFILDEEKKRSGRMTELVDSLESKLHVYRKQREEAESVASMNSLRAQTLRSELGSTAERADLAEQILNRIRTDSKARVYKSHVDTSYSSTLLNLGTARSYENLF